MILVLDYQTEGTTFSSNIFSFILFHQISFSKKEPYFGWLLFNFLNEISKNHSGGCSF